MPLDVYRLDGRPVGKNLFSDTSSADHITGPKCLPRFCMLSALGKSPCDGSAYAFRNRRSNRLKLLRWDGTSVWLCQRRLHGGHFVWPQAGETICSLSAAQPGMLRLH